MSSSPNTASGASRKSTPAASGGTRELSQTGSSHLATVVPVMRRPCVLVASGVAVAAAALAAPALAAAPRELTLSSGWERRVAPAAPAEPQPAPPEETAPDGVGPAIPATAAGVAAQAPGEWQPARVPSVFDTRALPALYPGQVRRYRVSFRGPRHSARVQLAAALRERPPQRGRVPERAPHRAQRRSLYAVHGRGPRPAAGAAERARRDRRRAQGPGPARGLVELERDRPAGEAGARRAGAHRGPWDDVARELPRAGARLPGRARSSTGCSSAVAPAPSRHRST